MQHNDETTCQQLRQMIEDRFGVRLGKSTIDRTRRDLGWTFAAPAYCQLVRPANQQKRMNFVSDHPDFHETCDDCIFTDETSIQLEWHRKRCARRRGQPGRPKPRPKHPYKVHLWAGISARGATKAVIFDGKMDRFRYVNVLAHGLMPFLHTSYPDGHRLIQDNDPKHTSKFASNWMAAHGINWFRTPPESPDLNPIEMVWHELKEFLRNIWKPRNKEQLIAGILRFWQNLDAAKCRRYISHLRKVVPRIAEVEGAASGL